MNCCGSISLTKGRPIFIDGRLDFDSWTAQDGTKRSKHRVTVENFQFLGGAQAPAANQGSQPTIGSNHAMNQQDSVDDIPF